MKKKILSLILTFAMLAGLSIVPLTAANAATGADIQLGQYLQLGTYYGKPVLWRCVGFEKNNGN